MAYTEKDDWTGDAHRGNDEVHYRIYLSPRGATTICVQWYDYFDYDARRILSPDAWPTEAEAATALAALMPTISAVDAQIGHLCDGHLRDIALAGAVRERIAADSTASKPGQDPQVHYLHVVLTEADVDHIKRGGQVRYDIDHKTGDGPPARVAVVYEPKALDDTSYYI